MCIICCWNPQQPKKAENIQSLSHNKPARIELQEMCMYDGHLRAWMVLRTQGRLTEEVVVVTSYTAMSGRRRRSAVVTALSASPPTRADRSRGHQRPEHGSSEGHSHQEPAPAGGFSPRWLPSVWISRQVRTIAE
jgi:hypothetical protein